MPKVAIVTDSTAYLPEELTRDLQIKVLPLSIIWDGQSYLDGVDIQPAQFYERLQRSASLPTTSQVTTPAIQDAFETLLDQGNDVLGIFLSSKFSGTFDAAVQAREMLPEARDRIALVDSRLTTMAMGLPVLATARAACAGESLRACQALAEHARDHSGVLFVVETLEFLKRGGRIGGAQALLGTLLNIKPVLGMRDGQIRIRGEDPHQERRACSYVENYRGAPRQPEENSPRCIACQLGGRRVPSSGIGLFATESH